MTMIEQWTNDLRHSDVQVRYTAAQQLGASNDAQAVHPLIGALKDENEKVQYAAFSGLIKLGDAAAAPAMIDLLLREPENRIWTLIKLNIGLRLRMGLLDLVQAGNTEIADQLNTIEMYELHDDHQRAFLVRLRGKTAIADQIGGLIKMLLRDNPTMRGAAAEALGFIGDARAIPPLMVAINDENQEVRELATEALGRIGDGGDEKVYDALVKLLKDDNAWVRRAAAAALADLGDRRAVEPLGDALLDDHEVVQEAAFEALKSFSSGSYTTLI